RGNGEGAAPVVLSAHLDTVFGPEVNVAVARRGQRLEGPGISDNARGLAALVAVAEAMVVTRVPTARPVLFAATVGEEGSGDLRGVKYLLNGKRETGNGKPAAFIALDGAGLERVVHRALGSKRYRVTFRGPGGHSWAAFGVANPANAVGRATALLADLPSRAAPPWSSRRSRPTGCWAATPSWPARPRMPTCRSPSASRRSRWGRAARPATRTSRPSGMKTPKARWESCAPCW